MKNINSNLVYILESGLKDRKKQELLNGKKLWLHERDGQMVIFDATTLEWLVVTSPIMQVKKTCAPNGTYVRIETASGTIYNFWGE